MPSDVLTLCFHTRDAVERRGSSFTFEMPSNRLRMPAAKVALASCEFPMVQWTLEESFNRLYTNEGVRIDDASMQTFSVAVKTPESREEVCVKVHLIRLNPVESAKEFAGTHLEVRFAHPHGLHDKHSHACLIGDARGDVALMGSAASIVDERTIRLPSTRGSGASFLYTPTFPSVSFVCETLTHALKEHRSTLQVAVRLEYDAERDIVRTVFFDAPDGCLVRVLPSRLSAALGISSMPHRISEDGRSVPSEPTGLWDYVELPPGFYTPCHRPLGTGAPMRISSEFEGAVNRLYFPLVTSDDGKTAKKHAIVFTDSDGRPHTAAFPSGRYTPQTFCLQLEEAMTRSVQKLRPDLEFTVSHNEDRFCFACESTRDGRVESATFGLLFNHPVCFDPRRIGFPAQPLFGCATYVASSRTRFTGGMQRAASNVVRISEIPGQKRFSFHSTTPPLMVSVVVDRRPGLVNVRTHVNGLPFAHGYQKGDVVCISSIETRNVKIRSEEEDGNVDVDERGAETVDCTAARIPSKCSCVVLECSSTDACFLSLSVPSSLSGIGDKDTSFYVRGYAEPWNMCLQTQIRAGPHAGVSTTCDSLGSRRFHTQRERRDGPAIRCTARALPGPSGLRAPHVFRKLWKHLDAFVRGENRSVFCKLSLYPLFREERMLPRDTTLLRDNMSRFTIAFWNPDLRTPYHFHGAEFSFSLSFVSTGPEGL